MKIKPKDYAAALVYALSKPGTDHQKITANFLKLLQKNGDIKKGKMIVAMAQELLARKSGGKKIVIETARALDKKTLAGVIGGKNDLVQEKLNPTLVAGIKITVNGNKQLDFSLQKKLNEIFN